MRRTSGSKTNKHKGGFIVKQINEASRNCATCAYWFGQRFPHRLGYVEVFSKMDAGQCGAKGLNESRRYQAVYVCDKYRRWQLLR